MKYSVVGVLHPVDQDAVAFMTHQLIDCWTLIDPRGSHDPAVVNIHKVYVPKGDPQRMNPDEGKIRTKKDTTDGVNLTTTKHEKRTKTKDSCAATNQEVDSNPAWTVSQCT